MSVLQDLDSQVIQGGHVDEQSLQVVLVHLLHFVWLVLNTAEFVAGHGLTGLVGTMPLLDIMVTGRVLVVTM